MSDRDLRVCKGNEIGRSASDFVFYLPVRWEPSNGLPAQYTHMRMVVDVAHCGIWVHIGENPDGSDTFWGQDLTPEEAETFFDFMAQAKKRLDALRREWEKV